MTAAVITVNYNNAERTIRFLRSLDRHPDVVRIVVDNASAENDRTALKNYIAEYDPSIVFIESRDNLGFSGGNNLGIRTAERYNPEWFIFINNDTEAPKNFLAELLGNLAGRQGLLGIPLRERGEKVFAGKIRWLKATLTHITSPEVKGDFYLIGGGVAVKKEVFKKIGRWNERYFLYFEDADLSLRAREAGFPLGILTNIYLEHHASSSTSRLSAPLLLRYHYRNAHLFNMFHAPMELKLALPAWSTWIIIKQLVKLIIMPGKRGFAAAIIAGVLDFYRGNFGRIT